MKHRDALRALIEEKLALKGGAEWSKALVDAGIPAGPIYTLDQVFADPQVKVADLVREVANEAWGPHKVIALPVRLWRTPAQVERAAPMTGEHTRATLEGLGYDADTIATLLAEGVIQEHTGGKA